jgi:hypothetical protein
MAEQRRIMIVGTADNGIKTFDGVVQAIREDLTSEPKRWQITMLDTE